MNSKVKKYIIVGLLGAISFTAMFAYLQYKKVMDYVIALQSIKFKKIAIDFLSFDIFLNFTNNSNIGFDIESQNYNVYVNDVFVLKAENNSSIKVSPKSTSIIGVNVQGNPKKALTNLGFSTLSLVSTPEKIIVKVDVKLKVRIFKIPFNIPYVYVDNLKNIMAPTAV